jgi:5-hydroxyisourate hydrolase
MPVRLSRRLADGHLVPAGEGRTDVDGRIRQLLDGPLTPGIYRVTFEVHEYRASAFFGEVTLELRIDDAERSYHVPLVLAPYGVSSYRGG